MKPTRTRLIVSTPTCPGRRHQREPVTVGLPLPRALADDPQQFSLIDDSGQRLPLQVAATDKWQDGSLRWVLLDFQVTGAPVPRRHYTLEVGHGQPIGDSRQLIVTDDASSVVVDSGAARFVLNVGSAFPFTAVVAAGRDQLARSESRLYVTDQRGRGYAGRVETLSVEARGPLRAAIRAEGTVGSRRRPMLIFVARLQFFAGSATVRASITLRNPRRARHRGGYWELGDPGSVYIKDAALHLASASAGLPECAVDNESAFEYFREPIELYQDSSGGEQWQHPNHVNREGRVPCSFRGYRLVSGQQCSEGLRATPAVRLRSQSGSSIGIAVEQFWQNCPQAIETEARALIYRLFPRQYGDLHELQGGEQKTHRFTLTFGDDGPGHQDEWFWGRSPSLVSATPAWYCASHAIPYLTPSPGGRPIGHERLIAAALDGPDSFVNKRERIDEYGWRHFGELYADHENAFCKDPGPIVSHYNNQYDAIAGFAAQLMRSGDTRWWALMDDLAHHVIDIDIYHTDEDKPAYNHGLFWHTAHYVDAGRSTHRCYPRATGVPGGGPSNEHNYATGLMLHYFLTGEPASRESAIGLARWAIAMDDGRQTLFRWLAGTPTGLASQTNSPDYHGPGRGPGHTLRALLDGHRLTGDAIFLDKAEELIRRVIHPRDDIPSRNLLDAERRWSYTAFLQALGAYLDHKAERDQLDRMYAHAQASLLHYARWMITHEYPYLDKPEILEFPTETWAAQDLRKSDVFYLASLHAADDERLTLQERGAFFFDAAVSRLGALESHSCTRPTVLVLTNGRLQDYVRSHPGRRAAWIGGITADVPSRNEFVPQKTVAKGRLLSVAGFLLAVAALYPLVANLID